MDISMTAKALNRYYDILKSDEQSQEELSYVRNIEFDLAKSLLEDFGEQTATKIAKLILASRNIRNVEYLGNFTSTPSCYSPIYLDTANKDNKYAIYCNK